MRIYKVKYSVDLFYNGKFSDTIEEVSNVASKNVALCIMKTMLHSKKRFHNFLPWLEKDPDTGKDDKLQYRNFEVWSCELVADSDF